jgi:hypothetical protein
VPTQWDQGSLPIGSAGLGLRRAAGHGAAAYLTSLGASGPLLQEIQGQDVEQEVPDTAEAMRSLNDQLGDHAAEPEPGPSPAGSRWREVITILSILIFELNPPDPLSDLYL